MGSVSRRLPRPLVSVVLPVYNEARALPEVASRISMAMRSCDADFEMIFVNDGSSDSSPAILDQLAAGDPRIRAVHLSRNFGHQAAIQAGLAQAAGDAVILMDSDLQDSPEALPRFVAEWLSGYDVVYAIRTHRKEGLWKRLLFTAFHRLLAAIATVPIPADAGIFGLIDRRVAREILALDEHDRYFPGLRSWVGFPQTGIVVPRNQRYDERPRVSLAGLFRLAQTAIFSFSTFPLRMFYLLGASAAVLFVGLSGYSVYCKLFTALAIPGWTSHVLIGSFFGALNALGIGILGEYAIRIYDQVRRRPLYLIDRTVNVGRPLPATPGPPDVDRQDTPYVDLLEEASALLNAGVFGQDEACAAEPADDAPAAVLLPFAYREVVEDRQPTF
jgi:dolichol-phosphate mannosyltransferase